MIFSKESPPYVLMGKASLDFNISEVLQTWDLRVFDTTPSCRR